MPTERLPPLLPDDAPLVGPYRLERELRRGGMGVVYLARSRLDALSPPVAVKMALGDDVHSVARFAQEVRATRSLDHPGIVRIRDDGLHHGRPWYAMDMVGYANLADVLARRGAGTPADLGGLVALAAAGTVPPLPLDQRIGLPPTIAVALLREISAVVAHAHARGVLHRDLKPANILLTAAGDPVLADFGVAQDLLGGLRLTAADEVVGSLTYIAPEQVAGEPLDERADVYALGVMLHECLTGRPPPSRRSGCEPLPLPAGVPAGLRAIVLQALEPDRAHRTASALALSADLARFARGEPVLSRGPSPLRRARQVLDRHPLVVAVLVAVLVVGAIAGLLLHDLTARQEVAWQAPDELLLAGAEPSPPQGGRLHFTACPLAGPGSIELAAAAGVWRRDPAGDGLTPVDTDDTAGHRVLLARAGRSLGLRVTVTARTAAQRPGEISVILGADQRWSDGYTFQLGAYENSCLLLKRDDTTVWMGAGRLEPQRTYRVALERVGERLRALVDDEVVVQLDDLLPVDGPLAGCFTYLDRSRTVAPVFTRLAIEHVDLPDLLPESWLPVRLCLASRRADGEADRQRLLDLAAAVAVDQVAALDPEDARWPMALLRRGALLDTAPGLERARHERLLREAAPRLHGEAEFHRQLLDLGGLAHSDAPAVVGALRSALAALVRPTERDRFLCWAERHLTGTTRLHALDLALTTIAAGTPMADFLAHRRISLTEALLGDLPRARRHRQELAGQPGTSFWVARTRSELLLDSYLRRDHVALAGADLDAALRDLQAWSTLHESAWLCHLMLGGDWRNLTAAPNPALTLARDRLLALLAGAGPAPDAAPTPAVTARRAALLAGNPDPDLAELLAVADRALPVDETAGWAALRPAVAEPLGDAAGVAQDLRCELVACLLAAHGDDVRLHDLARRLLWSAGPEHLPLAIALLAAGRRPAPHLVERSAGGLRTALRQILLSTQTVPDAPIDLAWHLGPVLELLCARRCRDLGDEAGARRRLERLAALGGQRPAARVARRLMAEGAR